MITPERTIVVGIAAGDSDAVALVAADFARRLDATLVCGVVDEAHYTVKDRSGHEVIAPIDSDAVDDPMAMRSTIEAHLHDVLDPVTTSWSVRFITGEPSAGLAEIAAGADALMLVIGTGRRTVGRTLREFFEGSIAAHLARRQSRPILVVPLDPAPQDAGLPHGARR